MNIKQRLSNIEQRGNHNVITQEHGLAIIAACYAGCETAEEVLAVIQDIELDVCKRRRIRTDNGRGYYVLAKLDTEPSEAEMSANGYVLIKDYACYQIWFKEERK